MNRSNSEQLTSEEKNITIGLKIAGKSIRQIVRLIEEKGTQIETFSFIEQKIIVL